jgi:hypothetical protein
MMDLEAFFTSAVPLYAEARAFSAVAWYWSAGVVWRAEAFSAGELRFKVVEPDTAEMEELVRGAGADRILEVYSAHPPVEC